jgi:hypothetical protein
MIFRNGRMKYHVIWHYDRENCVTECNIYDDDKILVRKGVTKCYYKDEFNKSKGRKTSLSRAISDLPKNIRELVWESYFSRKKVKDFS